MDKENILNYLMKQKISKYLIDISVGKKTSLL